MITKANSFFWPRIIHSSRSTRRERHAKSRCGLAPFFRPKNGWYKVRNIFGGSQTCRYPPRYLPKNRSKLMLTCTLFKIIERFVNISIKIKLLALRQNERLFKNYHPKIGQQFVNIFINIELLGLRKNARLAEKQSP